MTGYHTASGAPASAGAATAMPNRYGRAEEDRLLALCATGRLDAGLWRQHGSPFFMAGLATMLASARGFPRERLLGLARELYPGMADTDTFARWLKRSPVRAARFLPMLRTRVDLMRQIRASERYFAKGGKGLSFEEVFGEPLRRARKRAR